MSRLTETIPTDCARKSAIVLLSLDQSLAADVLARLPRDQVERVTLAIANAENVTREEQESILVEFKAAFQSRPLLQPAGPEAARELLERALERDAVEPVQQRIDEQVQAGPFAFLHNRHPDDIRRLIESEHPQTVAVISAQLPSNLAAQVLAGLSAETQADVLGRLARLGPTDVDVLAEIASLLHERIGRVPVRTGGVSRAADVLRETSRATSRTVLQTLDQQDSSLAGRLRGSLFSFKDLVSLDDESLQIVLEETRDCRWSAALKGSPSELQQRILSTLSPPLAKALKDEMNSVGPLRLSEITSAQVEISDAILSLDHQEQIALPRERAKSRTKESV